MRKSADEEIDELRALLYALITAVMAAPTRTERLDNLCDKGMRILNGTKHEFG